MAISGLPGVDVTVAGAITRLPLSKDGVNGFPLYNDNIVDLTVFSPTSREHKFTNLAAIEATGITADSTNFKDEYEALSKHYLNGGKEVWIGVYDVPLAAYDWVEVDELRKASEGEVRIYNVSVGAKVLAEVDILSLNAVIASFEPVIKKPAVAIYAANTGTLTLALFPNLRTLASSAPNVSVVVGQDLLNYPATVTGYSLPNIGAVSGALARTKVNLNILDVGLNNYAVGSSMNQVGIMMNDGVSDNVLVPMSSIDKADQDELADKGYIFWRYLERPGTYLSNDYNCSFVTDTFNSIKIVRTKNKAYRDANAALEVLIGASILYNDDGTMRPISANKYNTTASLPLKEMKNNNTISNYRTTVDPTQKPRTNNNVEVQIEILPTSSGDYINVGMLFVYTLA